jgi:DNA topoisomerase I
VSRLQALRIPPAWTDVWICTSPAGHLQATGRDQRGRKQYIYHAQWTQQQAAGKYERLLEFAALLPRIRRRIARDFAQPGLSKEKVLATVLRLMQATLIRVGNEQYVRENHSYGLTTLRDHHVRIHGDRLELRFRGKSGKWCQCDVRDARLAKVVHKCQELPGQQLLQYVDAQGQVRDVTSADVNEYLHNITGREFSAKDFRTWAATSLALSILCRECEQSSAAMPTKRKVVAMIDSVAARLNNTRSVCRKSYIHPGVIEAYLDCSLPLYARKVAKGKLPVPRNLSKQEFLAREILKALARRSARGKVGRRQRLNVAPN